MTNAHFYITGDSNNVLYTDTSSNGCVLWGNAYTKGGCFGGYTVLKLWEWDADGADDILVSTLLPAMYGHPQHWEDVK